MLIKLHAWVTEHLRTIASSLVATVVLFARIILAVELEEITILLLVKQLVLGKWLHKIHMIRWYSRRIWSILCRVSIFYAKTKHSTHQGSRKTIIAYQIYIKYISVAVRCSEKRFTCLCLKSILSNLIVKKPSTQGN